MPSVGQTTEELVIVEWLKREGETVALGESLFSVQTDKAQVEVESIAAGTLLKILRDAGETVQSGSPVAYVGAAGETVPDSSVDVDSGAVTAHCAPAAAATTERPDRSPPEVAPGAVAALPAARRLGSELGVDLSTIGGTGPGGVITVRDVEQAARDASLADETTSNGGGTS
jgi:pyruvate dehydrogenase E2 component (dihydrolipoamide acetyltransferase)